MGLDLMSNYIVGNALVLVPVLYITGMFLKNTPHVQDWLIPWIILAVGIVGGAAIIGLNADGVIQGILVAGVTVLGNQLIKQTKEQD